MRLSTLAATVRIQAEVLLWVIAMEEAMRRIFEAGVFVLPPAGVMGAPVWFKNLAALLEAASTVAILVFVFEMRFSPGATVRTRCRKRNWNQQKVARRGSRKIASALAVVSIFGLVLGITSEIASFNRALSMVGSFRNAAKAIVRDPILEEIFYRGVVFDRFLGEGIGAHKAAVASSILFGGMHFLLHYLNGTRTWRVNHQAAMAACIGYVYSLLFALGGSLLPVILLHSLNNIAAVCFLAYDPWHRTDSRATYVSDIWDGRAIGSIDRISVTSTHTPKGEAAKVWNNADECSMWICAQLITALAHVSAALALLGFLRPCGRNIAAPKTLSRPRKTPLLTSVHCRLRDPATAPVVPGG